MRFGQSPDLPVVSPRNRVLLASIANSLAVILGVGLIWYGQGELTRDARVLAYVPWLVGLALVIVVCARLPLPIYPPVVSSAPMPYREYWRWILVAFAAVAAIVLWRGTQRRAPNDPNYDLILLWLTSIAALTIAVTGVPRREYADQLRAWIRRDRVDILITVAIACLALVPRVYNLSSYPWTMSGDEGSFAVTAQNALHGDFSNPFMSGPWGYPSLLFVLQGRLMELTGETLSGARMLSAIQGVAAVVAIYWFTRHHFGRVTALVAAALAATSAYAVFWSRNTQNNIAPMLFYPLALLWLDRGLVNRRRTDSLIAGLVIGFAQYFHPGNRILFPIAGAYVVYAVLYPVPRSLRALVASARSVMVPAVVLASAALVTYAPQLGHYWAHPEEFWSRINQVSTFTSGWLDNEIEHTGLSMEHLLWIQFRNSAMLPFSTYGHGHFRPGVPFVGWPMAVPVAIGMGLVTATFWRRGSFGLAIAFWSTVVGLALTEGPPATNRYVAAGPFLVIFGALGITSVAAALVRYAHVPRKVSMLAAGLVTAFIAAWQLHFFFRDPMQIAMYADTNIVIATSIGRQTDRLGPDATLYFLGQPRMYLEGNENITFLAPDATAIDVKQPWKPFALEQPWTATAGPPTLTGPTLFAFVPERLGELDIVRAWFPDGTIAVTTMPDGEEVLTTYAVDAPVVERTETP